jgi:hypothetical protein
MTNYTKSTNFATKDTLTSGDPLKIVKGTEINTEFDNIATAVNSKSDTASPTFTGTVTIPTASVSSTTDSSSVSTGSIITAGGVGVAKALYVGTTANVAGAVTLQSALSVTGVTTVQAGTAAAPAITTTGDTNTGIFFPAADTIAFSEGGAEAMRIDSSGNVGIGTSSPTAKAQIGDATVVATNRLVFGKAVAASEGNLPAIGQQSATGAGNDLAIAATSTSGVVCFYTGASTNSGEIGTGSNTERMRIDSSGNLLVGTTGSTIATSTANAIIARAANGSLLVHHANGNSGSNFSEFGYNSTTIGTISQNSTTTVGYNTSSDYRLKNTIAPMMGALDKIAQLKPVTYKWNVDGSDGQGFIAHELAEIVPECVNGKKDAVDEDGNPKYQGVDTSFLVATLTAAIQELKALVDTQASTITTLTDRITALENK